MCFFMWREKCRIFPHFSTAKRRRMTASRHIIFTHCYMWCMTSFIKNKTKRCAEVLSLRRTFIRCYSVRKYIREKILLFFSLCSYLNVVLNVLNVGIVYDGSMLCYLSLGKINVNLETLFEKFRSFNRVAKQKQ